MTRHRAAFLDRDGTIIEDVNFISRPEDVQLRSGAAEAIRTLNEGGIPVVVITNQSGIARGFFKEAAYDAVKQRLDALLAAQGAHIDATYVCPHFPDATGPCDCRKPGRLLFDRAIADLDLDASRSMFSGDRIRDVLPALHYGGEAYLIVAASTPAAEIEQAVRAGASTVASLLEAVQRFR